MHAYIDSKNDLVKTILANLLIWQIPKNQLFSITNSIIGTTLICIMRTWNVMYMYYTQITVYGDKYFDNVIHITFPDAMGFFDIPIKVINPSVSTGTSN